MRSGEHAREKPAELVGDMGEGGEVLRRYCVYDAKFARVAGELYSALLVLLVGLLEEAGELNGLALMGVLALLLLLAAARLAGVRREDGLADVAGAAA